jgi:hypothetical protein
MIRKKISELRDGLTQPEGPVCHELRFYSKLLPQWPVVEQPANGNRRRNRFLAARQMRTHCQAKPHSSLSHGLAKQSLCGLVLQDHPTFATAWAPSFRASFPINRIAELTSTAWAARI